MLDGKEGSNRHRKRALLGTYVDSGIVNMHRLSKSLLSGAVGFVVLLKLSLENLNLFLGEARLGFRRPGHLLVYEAAVMGLIRFHGLGQVGVAVWHLRVSAERVSGPGVAPRGPLTLSKRTHGRGM